MEYLTEIEALWGRAPAHVQTYLSVQYPELWKTLNLASIYVVMNEER